MIRKSFYAAILALGFFGLSTAANAQQTHYDVVPLPNQIVQKQGVAFTLNAKTQICYQKGDVNLKREAQFLADYVKQATGLSLKLTTKVGEDNQILLQINDKIANAEGYSLKVCDKGALIQGKTPAGVFYGVQTLRKVLAGAENKNVLSAVEINDAPRFSYRGAHLDVSRHFITADSVRRFIDMLALHNINRFHWHLTDDQGWRIEIKKYPKLVKVGSYRPETVIGHNTENYDGIPHKGYYSQKEIRAIVEYAQERHITIVPEIDMPGHMQAALAAYPELGCTGGPYEVWKMWGVSDHVLCAGNDKVLQFIDDVLNEIVELFPSEYIHVGGDECPKVRWKDCPKCQARIKENKLQADDKHTAEERLQSYIIRHAGQHLASLGRKMIGWDEILEGGLAPGATVMSWRGEAGGVEAAKQGHDVVMTPNTYLYFDYYQSADIKNEPIAIGGCLPLALVYSYNPMPKSLTAEQAKHIVGVQANLWTEYIPTYRQVEYMELPRMAALSEVQWTAQDKRDYEAFRQRLPRFIQLYDLQGYNYAKHVFDAEAEYVSSPEKGGIIAKMSTIDGADIRYTLDGSEPTEKSALYDNGVLINKTATFKAAAFRPSGKTRTLTENFNFNKATGCKVTLLQPSHNQYTYGGAKMLTDGMWGETNNYNTGRWIAFSGTDLEAVVDLGKAKEISSVGFNVTILKSNWVMDARGVEISVSDDGVNYRTVVKKDIPEMKESDPDEIYEHRYNFPVETVRFVKVKALSEHVLPKWHGAKGNVGFLFVDELIIN